MKFIFIFSFPLILGGILAFAETGITDSSIFLGQSIDMNGHGRNFKEGSDLYFKKVNESGGIHGRKIQVISYNDDSQPRKGVENFTKLINQDKVFALFEPFGSPPTKAALPVINLSKVPLIAPLTSAKFLRVPLPSFVLNVRVSKEKQAEWMVDYLLRVRNFKKIAAIYQYDSLGLDSMEEFKTSFGKKNTNFFISTSFRRNTPIEIADLKKIKAAKPDVLMLFVPRDKALEIIKLAVKENFLPVFAGTESIWSSEFSDGVKSLPTQIFLTKAFPPLQSGLPLAKEYEVAATAAMQKPSDFGFEGYFNAALMVEGIKIAGKDLNRENLTKAFKGMTKFDLGGIIIDYAPDGNQTLSDTLFYQVVEGKLNPIKLN